MRVESYTTLSDMVEGTQPARAYRAFGLTLVSEFALPELPTLIDLGACSPDFRISLGKVPENLDAGIKIAAGVEVSRNRVLIALPEIRCLVSDGREIIVDPLHSGASGDLRPYLLGTAIGALLHQRGLLPLHANAVALRGEAIAIAGPAGAGKSTLAGLLYRRGWSLLADDVCVVTPGDRGRAVAWPGIPRIKLRRDALAQLGFDSCGLEPVGRSSDKLSLPTTNFASYPMPLSRIYVLNDRLAEDGLRPLSGARAVSALMDNIYRWEIAVASGLAKASFQNAMALLPSIEIFEVAPPRGLDRLSGFTELLERGLSG
jgi:hypothetical protein